MKVLILYLISLFFFFSKILKHDIRVLVSPSVSDTLNFFLNNVRVVLLLYSFGWSRKIGVT